MLSDHIRFALLRYGRAKLVICTQLNRRNNNKTKQNKKQNKINNKTKQKRLKLNIL